MEDFLEEVSFRLKSERSIEFRHVEMEEGTLDKGNRCGQRQGVEKILNMCADWSNLGWLNH